MRYEIGPLRRPAGRMTIELEAPAPPGTGAASAGLVRGCLELANVETGIAVSGRLVVPLKFACARCLGVFERTLEIEVHEDCALTQIDALESYAVTDDLCQIPLLNDEELDLTELVRQMIAMHLPTRALCREDCPGLCPCCGKDLSEGPCDCRKEETDPRWAGLRNLKLD